MKLAEIKTDVFDEHGRFGSLPTMKRRYRNVRRREAQHLRELRSKSRSLARELYREWARNDGYDYPEPISGLLTPNLKMLLALFRGELLSEWPGRRRE